MKLYGGLLSPFVMRPLLAARAKNITLDVLSPDISVKSPDYLALNPIGKVPTLVDGDFVLPESDVIAQYIDDKYPEPPLLPADAIGRARVRLMCRLVDIYIVPHLGGLFNARTNPQAGAAALTSIAQALDYIEHFRRPSDIYAVGGSYSLADCAMMPLFFFFDVFQSGLNTADMVAARPGLAAWWARAQGLEATQRATREMGEALQAFMKKSSS